MVGQVKGLRTLAATGNTAIAGNSITNVDHVNIWSAACFHPEYQRPWLPTERDEQEGNTMMCFLIDTAR
jgi:hypothetical protein